MQNKTPKILITLFIIASFLLLVVIYDTSQDLASPGVRAKTSQDAIAVRVIPNPEH